VQLADLDEIREMKNVLKQELEEISKLKEMMLKAGKRFIDNFYGIIVYEIPIFTLNFS
jgi:hypothetical protein